MCLLNIGLFKRVSKPHLNIALYSLIRAGITSGFNKLLGLKLLDFIAYGNDAAGNNFGANTSMA